MWAAPACALYKWESTFLWQGLVEHTKGLLLTLENTNLPQRQMFFSIFTLQMFYLKFAPEHSGTKISPAAFCDDGSKMKTSISQNDRGTLL